MNFLKRNHGINGMLAAIAVLAGCVAWLVAAPAPKGAVGKGVQLPEFDSQKRLKSVTFADEVRQQSGQQWLLSGLKVETYSYPDNTTNKQTDLVVESPSCIFDPKLREARSEGAMTARAADGRFFIEGSRFEWSQTNATLVISNKAHTVIKRELLSKGRPAGTGAQKQSDLEVFSDEFVFRNRDMTVLYRGNVRASDGVMKLTAGELLVKLVPGGGVESLTASKGMTVSQADSKAGGDEAEYRVADAVEMIEIKGNATWASGGAEGSGDVLIFDRVANQFRVNGNSRARILPKASEKKSTAPALAASTNAGPVEVISQTLVADLPAANGPLKKVVVEKGVLIKQAGNLAAGDRAVYEIADGREIIQLTGKPRWASDRLQGHANSLVWNRGENRFIAEGDAYLKLLPAIAADGKKPAASQDLEVFSTSYDFQPGAAHFRGGVRATSQQWKMSAGMMDLGLSQTGNQVQNIEARQNVMVEQLIVGTNAANAPWKLTSQDVTLNISKNGNQIENIEAKDKVVVRQLTSGSTAQAPWKLSCEVVNVKLSPAGNQIEDLVARENVVVEQVQDAVAPGKDPGWRLKGQLVNARFQGTNNAVETIVAEKQVEIDRGENKARGQKAVYDARTAWVELTGNPTLLIIPPADASSKAPRKALVSNAEVLLWNQSNNVFKAKGNYVVSNPDAKPVAPR
ncbi:MAG TPA: LptA/OstA family protein [Roseimicrobium sp.]|nr:LptA/OstA family protein [Roseimicrobium sp.]